jgi:hypothetical protein
MSTGMEQETDLDDGDCGAVKTVMTVMAESLSQMAENLSQMAENLSQTEAVLPSDEWCKCRLCQKSHLSAPGTVASKSEGNTRITAAVTEWYMTCKDPDPLELLERAA